MMNIVLLDPSLMDHYGNPSSNLGDLIISEAVLDVIRDVFGVNDIIRISTHDYLEERHYREIRNADYVFLGGTNLIYSNVEKGMNWHLSRNKLFYVFPGIRNLVLFGVGYSKYDGPMSLRSRLFYNNILSRKYLHSVRDSYTKEKLIESGVKNVINTACPTTWGLHGKSSNRNNSSVTDCIFMLTDYSRDLECDEAMIMSILQLYSGKIFYFPQGASDKEYLESLDIYRKNKSKISILPRSIDELKIVLCQGVNYVGTRLHGGIFCLSRGVDSLIVSIDNRAKELAKDINLPAINRGDERLICEWYDNNISFENIRLPMDTILAWKGQWGAS